jgi:hypothetical protein
MLYISNLVLKIPNIKLEINNEGKKVNKTRTLRYALFIAGITLCLTGAALMVHGSVFGDRTTGVATITGIVGIGLISTSNLTSGLKSVNKSQSKTANANDGGR